MTTGSRQGGDCWDFVTRSKSKIMKKMNQVWVKNDGCARCGEASVLGRMLSACRGVLRGVRSTAVFAEYWFWHIFGWLLIVFDGFFCIFLTLISFYYEECNKY